MKKSLAIFSALAIVAVAATATTFVVTKKKKEKAKKYENFKKEEEHEFVVYAFETFEEMQEAIESERFNVSTYYEKDGKSYIVVLADGTEDDLESYGGVRVFEETFSDVFSNTKVETMYFEFESEEYLMEFWKQVGKICSDNIKVPTLPYGDSVYVDLSAFDKSLYNKLTAMAIEYMGRQITDVYLAQTLEEYFSSVQ